jgi:hypothetical protein
MGKGLWGLQGGLQGEQVFGSMSRGTVFDVTCYIIV